MAAHLPATACYCQGMVSPMAVMVRELHDALHTDIRDRAAGLLGRGGAWDVRLQELADGACVGRDQGGPWLPGAVAEARSGGGGAVLYQWRVQGGGGN